MSAQSHSKGKVGDIVSGVQALRIDGREAEAKKEENHKKWIDSTKNLPGWALSNSDRPIQPGTDIAANFFKIEFNNRTDLYRYTVNFDLVNGKEPKKRELRRYLMTTLLAVLPAHVPTDSYATNYFSQIVSVIKIWNHGSEDSPDPTSPHNNFTLSHVRTGRPNEPPPPLLNSMITYQGKVRMGDLMALVRLTNRIPATLPEHFKALNTISWKIINEPAWPGGRVSNRFYPPDAALKRDLFREKISVYEARTGFFTSVRPGDGSLLLNVNTITTAFYPPRLLQTWILNRWGTKLPPSRENFCLIGLMVTTVLDNTGTKRTIASIGNENISRQKVQPNSSTTVLEQMRRVYVNTTFDATACCVNLGGRLPGNEDWYPADKLKIVPWQNVVGKVDDAFTKDMLGIATRNPQQNQNLIKNYALGHLGIPTTDSRSFWRTFGFTISPDFVLLKPRILKQPNLIYGNQVRVNCGGASKPATWNLGKVTRFYASGDTYSKLLVLVINSQTDDKSMVESFLRSLGQALNKYGINTTSYLMAPVRIQADAPRLNISNILSTAARDVFGIFGNPPILVILQTKDATYYSHVKWWGDCVAGVPTICCTMGSIRKCVSSTGSSNSNLLGNLCMKFNFKLSGQNHDIRVTDEPSAVNLKSKTLIIGADVTHSGKGQDPGCPSLAGVVGSPAYYKGKLDFHRYMASARLQSNNTEFIQDLEGMMVERLRKYYKMMNYLPQNILFYRDGVSESQFGMVLDEELRQIKAAIARAKTAAKSTTDTRITMLVVGKRHHARFYATPARSTNLQAGTVADQVVVTPHQNNFYLQSHDSPLGTARCAHYVVIANESNYTTPQLESITNWLCFTGSRATTGLSICTPAQYADFLCNRLRCYMKPVLDGTYLDVLKDRPVADYERDSIIWGDGDRGQNSVQRAPWKESLDQIMFYL